MSQGSSADRWMHCRCVCCTDMRAVGVESGMWQRNPNRNAGTRRPGGWFCWPHAAVVVPSVAEGPYSFPSSSAFHVAPCCCALLFQAEKASLGSAVNQLQDELTAAQAAAESASAQLNASRSLLQSRAAQVR